MTGSGLGRCLWASLSVIMFCMIGCTFSVYPILKDEQVIQSKSLAGTWVSQGQDDPMTFRLIAQADYMPDTDASQLPDLRKVSGRYALHPWGYRVKIQDAPDDALGVSVLNMRLGKIGTMTFAEFVAPAGQIGSGAVPDNSMFLPLYSCAKVEIVSDDHVRLWIMDTSWLTKYLAEHPDELTVLPADNNHLILNARTDELQAFLIKHVQEKQLWSPKAMDFIRVKEPATQPADSDAQSSSTQPASTQPTTVAPPINNGE